MEKNQEVLIDDSDHITEEVAEKELSAGRPFSYSNPRHSVVQRLDLHRYLGFFERNFRTFEKGSMRLVIITWIRMTMGVGVLALPVYFANLGVLLGVVLLALGGFLSYLSFRFIFEASVAKNLKDYKDLVAYFCPPRILSVFKVCLTLDYLMVIVLYTVVSWNLFSYILVFFGLYRDDWLVEPGQMKFKPYHLEVFLLRGGYLAVVYLGLAPLMLKRSLESLKYISMFFLLVMLVLLAFICAELPFFYQYHSVQPGYTVQWLWKTPNMKFLVYFFSFLLFYYVQPFVMSLRSELLLPTFTRLEKVSSLSCGIEFGIYLVFGVACYVCFGDKAVPELMLLREAYPNKNQIVEWVFRVLVIAFYLLTTVGIACFNPTFRKHLTSLSNIRNKDTEFKILSLVPFFFAVVIALFLPQITNVFGLMALLFCNFDGFIVPILVKLRMMDEEEPAPLKTWALRGLLVFYIFSGLVGPFYALSA